jgi:hypothetical protein
MRSDAGGGRDGVRRLLRPPDSVSPAAARLFLLQRKTDMRGVGKIGYASR